MSKLDWVVFIGCWMLVPGVLLMKVIMDGRDAKSQAKLEQEIAQWAADTGRMKNVRNSNRH